MNFKIFVEGIADKRFLEDFISIHYSTNTQEDDIITTGGWTKLISSGKEGEMVRNKMTQHTDNGGVNLLIFDADNNRQTRTDDIKEWQKKYNLNFHIFLWPDNKKSGGLETVLENIINPSNQPIFDCWNNYEKCLQEIVIQGRTEPLTIPARKTKIYGYLESLLEPTESQKEKIKERNRDYTKTEFWDLHSNYLTPLKQFLDKHINIRHT